MKCFKYYNSCSKQCEKKDCRYWINSKKDSNCVVNISMRGPSTLQDIGSLFGITRMRVCQIEKKIVEKIKKRVSDTL